MEGEQTSSLGNLAERPSQETVAGEVQGQTPEQQEAGTARDSHLDVEGKGGPERGLTPEATAILDIVDSGVPLADVSLLLRRLMSTYTKEGALLWLVRPRKALNGQTPLQALKAGDWGKVSVLIDQLDGMIAT